MPETQVVRRDAALRSPANSEAAPVPRPPLLSRIAKYTLIVGGLCAAVGAAEGVLTGYMLSPNKVSGALILVVAADRFVLLGIAGGVIGAVIGTVDWCLWNRKKKKAS